MMPVVSVVVAVYRHHEPPTVADLARSMAAALDGLPAELIVVLNGIDASGLGLPEHTRTVALPTNHGVGIAWNRGAAVAEGEVVVFANDDLILGPHSLRLLVEALQRDSTAAVAGPTGALWDIDAARHTAYVDLSSLEAGTAVPVDMVSGYCFAVRRDIFETLGGIDEAYTPAGFEEIDLCTAVRAQTGRTVIAVAGVKTEHEFSISSADPRTVIRFLDREESLGSIERRNKAHFLGKWRGQGITSVSVPQAMLKLPPPRWKVAAHDARRRLRERWRR